MSTERVMIVSTLERLKVGRQLDTIPPHVTHIAGLELPAEEQEALSALIEDLAEENAPYEYLGGSRLQYGDEQLGYQYVRRFDTHSTGFNPVNNFFVQAGLYSFAKRVDSNFDDTYFGLNWNAHTHDGVQEHEIIKPDNITVIGKDRKIGRKVVRQVHAWERL